MKHKNALLSKINPRMRDILVIYVTLIVVNGFLWLYMSRVCSIATHRSCKWQPARTFSYQWDASGSVVVDGNWAHQS